MPPWESSFHNRRGVFHARFEKAHFTYKTWMDVDDVRAVMDGHGDIRIWSFVHESSDIDEQTATPYDHTHVFVWWKKRISTVNCKAWDVGGIHPNVQSKRGIKWARHICMKYHLGQKKKVTGESYFKTPEFLMQEGVAEWKLKEEMIAKRKWASRSSSNFHSATRVRIARSDQCLCR